MSRQQPIYIYSSEEEEPFEDEGEVAHEPEQPVHRVTSDDTTIDTPVSPPAVPVSGPTQRLFAESSRGPFMRRTPRMCVRDFPTGPLAPRDKAPVTEREVPMDAPPPQRLRPSHLDWMPSILRRWRSLEGIPSTYETGESSHTPSPSSMTGEPLELTVPTLVAVIRTIFGLHYGTRNYIRELQSDVSRLDGDMADLQERCHFLLGNMVVAREIAESARTRVRVLETRVRIAGFMLGFCLLLAVLRTAIGLFLPYFY